MSERLNELHRFDQSSIVALKTKTNIRHSNLNHLRPVEYWGSLVDIQSREILVSFNTAEKVQRKVRQLTVKVTRETGLHLKNALLNALCLRSHSYYFDRLYTSNETFLRNFFYLSKYFLQRLHAMCVRFRQFYSKNYLHSKTKFLFRTIRAALNFLVKRASIVGKISKQIKQQCKYVFLLATIRFLRQNPEIFQQKQLLERFCHMNRKLRLIDKNQRHRIQKWIGILPIDS